MLRVVTIGVLVFAAMLTHASAGERFEFRPSKDSKPIEVKGKALVEAQDGGVMMVAEDGRIWTIQPNQMVSRTALDGPLKPIDTLELKKRLIEEKPGFQVYQTAHYVILHNANEAYVKRVGFLFEQLYKGFFAYWKNQGWDLPEPKFPLVALVFADRNGFLRHGLAEVGETANSVIGYYHLSSNRMTTYYVKDWERNIATIIHEATHQLAYNCGMQTRFADNPMWVSEGLAMFFEAPDFGSSRGWRTIGKVNPVNLKRWRAYTRVRPQDSLATLISDDKRFRDASTATDAYGESWALTYFLIRTHKKEYVQYMRKLSEGKRLAQRTARERIAMFEEAFGANLASIDREFVAYIRRLR